MVEDQYVLIRPDTMRAGLGPLRPLFQRVTKDELYHPDDRRFAAFSVFKVR
jgi:hypothetical protein